MSNSSSTIQNNFMRKSKKELIDDNENIVNEANDICLSCIEKNKKIEDLLNVNADKDMRIMSFERKILNFEKEEKQKNDKIHNLLKENQVHIEFKDYIKNISLVFDEINKSLSEKIYKIEDDLRRISSNIDQLLNINKKESKMSLLVISRNIEDFEKDIHEMFVLFNSILKHKHNEYLFLLNEKNKILPLNFSLTDVDKIQYGVCNESLNIFDNKDKVNDKNKEREIDKHKDKENINRKEKDKDKIATFNKKQVNACKEKDKVEMKKEISKKIKSQSPRREDRKINEYNIDYLYSNEMNSKMKINIADRSKCLENIKDDLYKEGKYSKLIKSIK